MMKCTCFVILERNSAAADAAAAAVGLQSSGARCVNTKQPQSADINKGIEGIVPRI